MYNYGMLDFSTASEYLGTTSDLAVKIVNQLTLDFCDYVSLNIAQIQSFVEHWYETTYN
jgi:hypothetical protein